MTKTGCIYISKNGEINFVNEFKEDLLYVIHCEFDRLSSTGITEFYSYKLYDNQNNRINDNCMNLFGINCFMSEKEIWDIIYPPNSKGLSLKVLIIDALNNNKDFEIPNARTDKKGFNGLFNYLNMLKVIGTHYAYDIIEQKEKEIKKLKNKIDLLKK